MHRTPSKFDNGFCTKKTCCTEWFCAIRPFYKYSQLFWILHWFLGQGSNWNFDLMIVVHHSQKKWSPKILSCIVTFLPFSPYFKQMLISRLFRPWFSSCSDNEVSWGDWWKHCSIYHGCKFFTAFRCYLHFHCTLSIKWNSATVYCIASAVFSVHCCFSAGCRKSHCTLAQCAFDCSVQCVEHLTLSWTLIFHSTDLSSWPTFQWLSSFSCTLHISKTKVIQKYKNKQIDKCTNT